MSDEAKKIHAVFYAKERGGQPVREWLKFAITESQRKAIGKHLQVVEYGWPMGMPTVRKIESDLWELRVNLDVGIARVFFTVDGAEMVLLHAFIKKSKKTPMDDLELARRRLTEVRRK